MPHTAEDKQRAITRLRRIKGQAEALERAVEAGAGLRCRYPPSQRFQKFRAGRAAIPMRSSCS